MTFTEGQILVTQMRAMRAHAEIMSGAYKQMRTETMSGGKWRQCTDEEKLARKVQEMDAHIRFMQECVDALPPAETDVAPR